MFLASSLVTLLAAGSLAVAAPSHGAQLRPHHGVARANVTHPVEKRFSGHATYFAVGLGACGKHSSSGDYIVALDSAQYGGGYPGPNCFRKLTISGRGKTATATVMDECPTCPYGSLDMSQGLFEHFAPTSVGEFPITWTWGSGGGDDSGDDDEKTTTHHTTTHHTTHTTTTTHKPTTTDDPKTTTTTDDGDSSSSSTSDKKTSTSTTSSAASTTSAAADDGDDGDSITNQQMYVANVGNMITWAMGN